MSPRRAGRVGRSGDLAAQEREVEVTEKKLDVVSRAFVLG